MNDVWQHLAERKILDEDIRREIEAAFGTRGKKALTALDEGKVKKYLDFFVVEGRTARYIVEEEFCTCGDFLYRGRTCWHLLAVRIAQVTGTFETIDSWYQDQLRNTYKQNLA
jgi:predicted nucleic acid-binding Zn finger protein